VTPQQFERVEQLFNVVCDLPADQRTRYLDEHCADDAEVRQQVASMLARDDSTLDRFDTPALGNLFKLDDVLSGAAPKTAIALPDRIGNYTIIRKIGEGGMGVVLEARQDQPARHVAIKLIRDSIPTAESLRRFNREIELLGQLQHACIAHIYDAGLVHLPNGAEQPYYAMEYIDGQPLTEYVAAQALDMSQRLLLVARACDAVAFAHQRGILHRDLKPSNILVKRMEHGDNPAPSVSEPSSLGRDLNLNAVPKILDFGLGRLLDDAANGASLQTHTGRVIGTLAYMSPEQIDGGAARLDIRTDVYSLGVILYEVLAGKKPHELTGLSIAESARRIRETEPAPLASLDRALRGDLSTIVDKALAKDRARRYASAADLAADLRRFLNDEPIMARPATALYQMRKFARRHKAVVAGGAIAVCAMLAAIVVTSRQALIATAARDEARREAHKAKAINGFLQEIFSSEAFDGSLGEDVTAVALLDVAAQRLDRGHFGDQPDVIAELHVTLGHSYLTLGRYATGQQHFERARDVALEIPNAAGLTARVFEGLGAAHELQNAFEKAETCYRDARKHWAASGQSEHAPSGVWPHGLPSVLYLTGRYEEAERLYREALAIARQELTPDDIRIAQALSGLGATLEARSQLPEAIAAHQASVEIYRAAQGDTSMHVANCLNNLGNAKQAGGDFAGAAQAHREALNIRRTIFRPDHPDIAMSLGNLGLVLMNLDRLEEAERMTREALAIRRKVLPPVHFSTATTLNNLALTLRALERYAEAIGYFDEAITMAQQALPDGHIMPVVLRANRAYCLLKMGRTDEAEPIMLDCHAQLVTAVGEQHRRTRKVASELAELYDQLQRADTAKQWRQRSTTNPSATPDH
jgi:serine/threonine protein kinase/Tfp pilus assembly protein PilF